MSNPISGFSFNLPIYEPSSASQPTPASPETRGGFGEVLRNAVDQVNQLENTAGQQATDLLEGSRSDVQNVMISIEKADVAFQLMMQVRNKIVNAYQQVSQMQF